MKIPTLSITIASTTVIRTVALVIITLGLYIGVRHVGHVIELIVISAFLSLAANPLTGFIQRRFKTRRLAAVTFTFFVLILFIGLFLFAVIPPLIKEVVGFIENLPANLNAMQSGNNLASHIVRRFSLQQQLTAFVNDLATNSRQYSTLALNTLSAIGTSIAAMIAVMVMIFMMLLEGPLWIKRLWALQSPDVRSRYTPVAKHMYEIVTAYVNGQIIISIIGGVTALIPLMLLRVPNAVALAAIVAITGLIPLIGHPLGAAVVVLATLLVSLPKAIIMLIFFIVYLQLENISLQPYIQSKKNELTPLVVFMAALVGIEFGGLIGAFLMIPFVACVRILIKDYIAHNDGRLES